MRMSSFIMGGLVGAAAVVYLSRNNKPMAFDNFNQVMGRTKNTMMDFATSTMNRGMNMSSEMSKNTAEDKRADLDKVEKIVNEDPKVKAEVDKIMMNSDKTEVKTTTESRSTTH
jgi:hypothetical protein